MFFEYKSTSLSELAKVFAEKTTALRFGNPFQQKWVVIQNKEAQQWLTQQVAKYEGIAFNFEFILPSELMWKLYRIEHPELPSNLPSDRIAMQWQMFEVLKLKGNTFGLPSLPEQDKNLFQLAGQIADVMDLYQVFRPELLESWERNTLTTFDASEKWQMNIWNELTSIWEEKYPAIPNRKEAWYSLKESVDQESFTNERYPDSIFIFGLSQISASFLDLITTFSKKREVHFFDINLKPEITGFDVKFTEWLKPKEEFEKLLERFSTQKKITYTVENLPDLKSESLLAKLSIATPDLNETIEIHSCHNPKREVEVLKDSLLSALDERHDLNPDDILVLVPDMDEYAPIIESVFQGEEQKPQIPIYSPKNYLNQSQNSFIAFLELISSNYKISDVIDFLEIETIRERFIFSEEDIFTLKNWLLENRIHWGLELSDSIYSLEKAVSNFISGFAMELDEFEYYEDFIPFNGVNTSDHAELVARFSSLVHILKPIKAAQTKNRSLKGWLVETSKWVSDLFQKNEKAAQNLSNSIDRLIEYAGLIDSTVIIDFNLFKNWFKAQLSDKKASSSGFGHGVVLSSYIPYRSIPFKQVCILGMNEGVFPRNATRPSFDLIYAYPKAGDRIMKEDDQLLFMELLASTSQGLFISFLGQDQHSENEKLPSILIQKVMDEVDGLKAIEHKLHGFDNSYFLHPKSYSQKRKELGIKVLSKNENELPFFAQNEVAIKKENIEHIEINELISFFVHPCKHMLNNGLSVRKKFENSDLEDREVFRISALDKYNLDQLLQDGIESHIHSEALKEYSILAGFTPQGIPGIQAFETELNSISELRKLAKPYLTSEERKGELDIEIDEIRLVGSFDNVYGDKSLFIKAAKLKARDFVNSWIKHLILSSSSYQIKETIIVGRDFYGNNQVYGISVVEGSKEILAGLVAWFIKAKEDKALWTFFPETSKTLVEAIRSEKENPLKEASKKWIGSEYVTGEGTDFYNSLCCRGETPLELSEFRENAVSFWEPFFAHFKKIKQ